MKRLRRPTALIVTVALVCSLFGCAPVDEPVLVYSYAEPDLTTPSIETLRGVTGGDPVEVVLIDGSSFEATFKGIHEDVLSFSHVKWQVLTVGDQTLASEVDRTSTCALAAVSLVYLRDESSSMDAVLGWGSLIVLATMFAAFAYGQGGGE